MVKTKTAFKILKFNKRKVDEFEFISAKINGKIPGKVLRLLKSRLNQVVAEIISDENEEKASD